MNSSQIVGVARVVVPALLAYGVARGWWSGDQTAQLSGDIMNVVAALVTVGAAVWSFMSHRKDSQIERVAGFTGVHSVEVTPEVKQSVGFNPKVVARDGVN